MKIQILKRDNFTCQKCGFKGNFNELEVHHIILKMQEGKDDENNLITLCSICHKHAPDSENEFKKYLKEKIDWRVLDTFRKFNYSISKRTKQGMINNLKKGKHLSKAPKGYNLVNKELIINEQETEQVNQIFEEFLNSDISLTQLAKKHNMTTAGIKKLLKNTTYLGKVKFAGKENKGQHKPIIKEELFQKVQDKINRINLHQ